MITCPRCTRANPPQALFCYEDGVALGDPARASAARARLRFPMPFVFSAGRPCHTFDELVLACLTHWAEARDMLRQGVFTTFLAGIGRGDLAASAREACRLADPDGALDVFLRRLPAEVMHPPALEVEPSQINLGSLRVGQDARFELHLRNKGMGLLQGTVSCEECPWLFLGEATARSKKKVFQALHETTIPVHVRGKALAASARPLIARLQVQTAAGTVTVPVKVEVPVRPFAEGVLGGATTPRQIAEKAREHPHEAAALFARGLVALWYESNGWTYPVQEPSASGVAAVQQFFEALGLTRPTRVGISAAEVRLEGQGGAVLRSTLQVVGQEKRPVYARASSDQPWLRVTEVELDGWVATVHLRVASVPDRPGETLRANLTIKANGRQRFVVPVTLAVTEPAPAFARGWPGITAEPVGDFEPATPIAEVDDDPPRTTPARRDRDRPRAEPAEPARANIGLALLPVAFLVLGLSITLARDLWALLNNRPGGEPQFPGVEQLVRINFHDVEEAVQLAPGGTVKPAPGQFAGHTVNGRWEPSMRFGLTVAQLDPHSPPRRLTFQHNGTTNNAVVRLDGRELLFGERPFKVNGREQGNWPGRWFDRDAKPERPLRDGRSSIWVYDDEQVYITQTVGLVPGPLSGKLDTCLVHYKIANKDDRPHTVGLRFLLDTFIGSNDGVPFLIPGREQLCSTFYDFDRPQDVPDFIQALESEDLRSHGIAARIQLKLPGIEPPSRVTLGAWPNPALGGQARQEKTLWDVPVLPIRALNPADSAVTIYWNDRVIPPGGTREVAFAYGLGDLAGGESGGRLALTTGGSFTPRGEFTLTAYVNNPAEGEMIRLALPDGFTRISGDEVERVPALPFDAPTRNSPVTWRVRAGPRTGQFPLTVTSSTGARQSLKVEIKVRGIFGS